MRLLSVRAVENVDGRVFDRSHMFQVVHDDAILYLEADTPSDRAEWCVAIFQIYSYYTSGMCLTHPCRSFSCPFRPFLLARIESIREGQHRMRLSFSRSLPALSLHLLLLPVSHTTLAPRSV